MEIGFNYIIYDAILSLRLILGRAINALLYSICCMYLFFKLYVIYFASLANPQCK